MGFGSRGSEFLRNVTPANGKENLYIHTNLGQRHPLQYFAYNILLKNIFRSQLFENVVKNLHTTQASTKWVIYLEKLKLVKLGYGGLVLGSSQF